MIGSIFWCVADGAPVRMEPGKGSRILSLAMYTRVQVLKESLELYQGVQAKFYEVICSDDIRGWVYASYLEPYIAPWKSNIVKIRNGTASKNDAEQYLTWDGKVQYNLCGFFCAAYCAGWDADIEVMLDMLKAKKQTFIARVFGKSLGTTGPEDLDIMLSELGYKVPLTRIGAALKDRVLQSAMLTPARLQLILESYRVIYAVKINKRSGRLARSGVLHWVVLEDIVPNDFGGAVDLYNPFGNKRELYEWDQLVESGGVPYGILVPRK